MMIDGQDWAVAAARAILDDISTRSRLGPALEAIDPGARRDMETTFAGLVRGALEARLTEAADAPLPDGAGPRCVVIEGEAAALYQDGAPVLLVAVDAGEVLLDMPGEPGAAPVAMSFGDGLALADHIRRRVGLDVPDGAFRSNRVVVSWEAGR